MESKIRSYEEMKDSGVEWIGVIPKDWDIVRFKRMHRGSNVGLSLDKDYWSANEDDTVFYTAGLKSIHTSYKDIEPEMLTKENDLLLARNGTPYVYFPCVGAIYTDHIIRVGIENGYNKAFVRYCLQQSIAYEVVDTVSIATWSVPIWNRQCLPHPSLPEQAAIAAYLDDKCGAIDDIITEAKAGIEEYKAWKASVIFEAVTKGLDLNAEMKDSGVEWIGQIPKGWSRDKITRIYRVIGSGTTPKFDEAKDNSGPINWILSGDVYSGGVITDVTNRISENFLSEYSALKLYQLPFVVIAMYGASIGNMAVSHVSGCVNQACCVLGRPREDFDFNYAYYALQALKRHLLSSAFGGGQPNVSQQIIKAQWLPMPPRSEQVAIAAYLDDKCSAIDSVIAEKEVLIAELETYKKSLIFETVTGKRRVC